jgi:SMP-30/Gluconolactonase/LRE-like region
MYRTGGQSLTSTITSLRARLAPLVVPNGLAFSAAGRTMYLSDSQASVQRIWAFNLNAAVVAATKWFVAVRIRAVRPQAPRARVRQQGRRLRADLLNQGGAPPASATHQRTESAE